MVKLKLFSRQLNQNTTTHFATFTTTTQQMISTEMYINMIFELVYKFGCRFAHFPKLGADLILCHHRLQPNSKKHLCYTAGTD